MAEELCEMCEEKPAKFLCNICDTQMCPKDFRLHEEKFPDHPSIPLRKKGTENPRTLRASQQADNPELAAEFQQEASNSMTAQILPKKEPASFEVPQVEPILKDLVLEEGRKASSSIRMISIPILPHHIHQIEENKKVETILPASNKIEVPRQGDHGHLKHAVEQPSRDQNASRAMLFESHIDVAQQYKLYKWMLNSKEATQFIAEMREKTHLKVVGIYGCFAECLQLVAAVLKLNQPPEFIFAGPQEGIVAFYQPELPTLCLVFKIEKEETYFQKPYPESSREAIYIRLLMDMCPVLISCPSIQLVNSWYVGKNPFVPKIHASSKVTIQTTKSKGSDLEQVQVVFDRVNSENLMLTNDNLPYCFTTSIQIKDIASTINGSIEKLSKWIERARNNLESMSRSYCEKARRPHFPDFDCPEYILFTASLSALLEKPADLVNNIREYYIEVVSSVQTNVETLFDEKFVQEFRRKYAVTESADVSHGYKNDKRINLSETIDGIRESIVSSHKFTDLSGISKSLESFVERLNIELKECNESEETFEERKENQSVIAKTSVDNFLRETAALLKDSKKKIINDLLSEFQREIGEYINQIVRSVESVTLAFRTVSISVRDSGLCLEDIQTENLSLLIEKPNSVFIHMLEKEVGFVMTTLPASFRASKFNPLNSLVYNIEHVGIEEEAVFASGSNSSLFVAFLNKAKRAYYGAAKEMKKVEDGTPLEVYESIETVISACLLQKTRKVILIDQNGHVFTLELVGSRDKRTIPILVEIHNQTTSDGASSESTNSKTRLTPKYGDCFYNVKRSDDETLFFLQSERAIEIYDLNFTFTRMISIQNPNVAFKILSWKAFNYVLVKDRNELSAYRFENESERVESVMEESDREDVSGNPIIDIIHFALFKFGSSSHFQSNKPLLYIYTSQKNSVVEDYIGGISSIRKSLEWKKTLLPSRVDRLLEDLDDLLIETEDFKWRLLTRAPLHIASIQKGNMTPLQDGLDHFEDFTNSLQDEDTNFVTAFVNYIRLGSLECIIKEARNLKVISIMGRQSSGKSYLLNRLFGTRFDVASNRCTDGIWLSMAKVNGQVIIVLDCEGLFSAERSAQEEIKLCLLLAAISDYTVLNQDLTFNRCLNDLFEKCSYGIDRLKGSDLFRGVLEIAIRDLPQNQDKGANSEVKKFVDLLISQNKTDVLHKLFQGVFLCFAYHNFEKNKLFEEAVNARRSFYLTDSPIDPITGLPRTDFRWKSGEDFLTVLKTVMAQIYADDGTAIDSRLFQLKLRNVIDEMSKALHEPSTIAKLIHPANPDIEIDLQIANNEYSISFKLFEVKLDIDQNVKVFEEFLEQYSSADVRKYEWNEWHKALEQLIKKYFEKLKVTMLEYLENKFGRIDEEFRPVLEIEKLLFEKLFDKVVIATHQLCLRKCKECDLCCLQIINHSGNCDCRTNHMCVYPCGVCGLSELCSQKAGHLGVHCCKTNNHKCNKPCSLLDCKGLCVEEPFHETRHKCSARFHPCQENCAVYQNCKRMCVIDQLEPHEVHTCKHNACPFKCCVPECSSPCQSKDHLHSLSEGVSHFCSNQHPCFEKCEEPGVCELKTTSKQNKWVSESNMFFFNYVKQEVEKCKCTFFIPAGQSKHCGPHKCEKKEHKCMAQCPDCGAYCELKHEHYDLHSSAAHRNKEKCIYLDKKEQFSYEYEDESGRKNSTRSFHAGESAKPEFCDLSCGRKGRGHTHPFECRGGFECLEQTCPGLAIHSPDRFYPDTSKQYDLVECSTYWKLRGWEPPQQKKDKSRQQMFSLCPVYCASEDHDEKVYCEGKLFHTNSQQHRDHYFPQCKHGFKDYDVSFVLDCTYSMDPSFEQVKEVITSVINKYETTSLSVKFAIVGYTDHYPDNGLFPASPPILVYPPSGQLDDFSLQDALQFLSNLKASGGGCSYGEAMLDGINASNTLVWRPAAGRMVIIITDDSPHGEEFNSDTQHPKGCPCKLNWKALLRTMKSVKVELRLISLSCLLNKTVKLFKTEYGPGFVEISLEDMSAISFAVEKNIIAVLQHNMEYARD